MKRKLIFAAMLIAMVATAFSIPLTYSLAEVQPKDARSMGMGGAFRVFSQGYSSFFGNPAGFAGMSSLTLVDLSTWAYLAPTTANLGRIQKILNGSASQTDLINYVSDWMITNNGFGAGASLGAGWVGAKGLSIGVNMVTDELAYGDTLLGSKLTSATQVNGVIGLAYPIHFGPVWFKIGADGRVFYHVQSDPVAGWPFSTILNNIVGGTFSASTLDLIGGYGFAADAGIIFGVGPVMLGFSARDIGMEFKVGGFNAQDFLDNGLSALPIAGTLTAKLTPSYTAGLGIRLFENGAFEPSVYGEVDNPIALVESSDILTDLYKSLHAGAQLRLLKFISLRGGLNKGWYSVGAGIDLSLLEIDAALFTEETGLYPGDKGRSGISVQAAIRFGR